MGWKTKRLGELCDVFTDGNWIETKDQSSSGVRLIQTGNVGIGVFKDRADKARFISEDTFSRLKCTEIFPGDCLISRLPDPAGRACVVPETGSKMITAVDCTIVRFKNNIVMPDFFNYFSQSKNYLAGVDVRTSGATRKRISRKNLGQVEIPVPSLAEQKQIVAILDEAFINIDHARQLAERNFKNTRELFDSTLHHIFIKGGKGWVQTTLDKLADNCDSKRVPITKSDRKSGEYRYFGASGVVDYVDDYLFEGNYLLISEDGANLLARSTPVAFSVSGKFWVNNHAHILKFKHMETQKIVEYYFESIKLDPFITGAAQPKLNQKALNSIPIRIPEHIKQQSLLTTQLNKVENDCQRLTKIYQQKITALDELKQSLLQKAFRGELTQAKFAA